MIACCGAKNLNSKKVEYEKKEYKKKIVFCRE